MGDEAVAARTQRLADAESSCCSFFTFGVSTVEPGLVAFDIVNLRNRFVASIYFFLDGIARPLLYPIQRMIPPLGGVDISPIIALLIIQAMQRYLLPAAYEAAMSAFAGA